MRRIKDYFVYLAVRVFLCIIQAMRMETCHRIATWLAWLANDVFRVRRSVTEENLTHVFPDWTPKQRHKLSRDMWEHLFLMVCELAHVPRKIHDTNWRQYIQIPKPADMMRYILDPRPVVVVSGHFGNFEMGSYASGLLGFPTYSIARPLDNPYLHKFITKFRSSKGQFILPTEGSAKEIERVLKAGRTLALLGDQNAGRKGCWVDFLGRSASCHKALAVFTISAGAPMVISYARRTDRPLHFEIGVPAVADPKDMDDSLRGIEPLTQWYNQKLEELIMSEPSQYWWLHRRWKGEPPARRRKRSTSATPARPSSEPRQVA